MQENVNAVNVINQLVYSFGDVAVSTCDAGVIKLQVKALRNGDITTIANLLQIADVQIKRSGTGLLILFIPKLPMDYSPEIIKALETIEGDLFQGEADVLRD